MFKISARDKVNPNKKKASREIADFILNKYFETWAEAVSGILGILQSYGFDTQDFDQWSSQMHIYADTGSNEISCNSRKTIDIGGASLQMHVYRVPSGKYEVTAYIS